MHEKKKLINDSFQPLESLAVNLRKQNSSNKFSVSQSMVLTDQINKWLYPLSACRCRMSRLTLGQKKFGWIKINQLLPNREHFKLPYGRTGSISADKLYESSCSSCFHYFRAYRRLVPFSNPINYQQQFLQYYPTNVQICFPIKAQRCLTFSCLNRSELLSFTTVSPTKEWNNSVLVSEAKFFKA